MNHLARKTPVWVAVFLSCVGFVLMGLALLRYPGIQEDEALVGGPLFGPVARGFRIRVFHRDLPLMAMDYVGALKSWLYWPIFAAVKPSPFSLRFPVLLMGALTIWMFYLLLRRIGGTRAAIAGCLLLATDTSFLLTTEFDWGPVAIQHLMLVAACLFLFKFVKTGSAKFLGAGFFALGLGLWDKALFAWVISGLVAAASVVLPKQLLARITARNLACALAGFLLGVWPLLVFNVRDDWRTVRNRASFSAAGFRDKVEVLRDTADGSGLFDYLVSAPLSSPRHNFLLPAILISVLAMPWLGASRRAILFALVFMAATWIQMAFTRNAGGAVHHAILLWPFPQLVVAIAFAELSQRWARAGRAAFAVAIAGLCAMNLLVTNQYREEFIRNGPSVTWTDAIYALSDALPAGHVFVMDWDILSPLRLLHGGRRNIQVGFDAFLKDAPEEQQRRMIGNMLTSTDAVFVAHTPGNEFFPAPNQRLESEAAARGFRKELIRTVPDSHGRPVFQVYKFLGRE